MNIEQMLLTKGGFLPHVILLAVVVRSGVHVGFSNDDSSLPLRHLVD